MATPPTVPALSILLLSIATAADLSAQAWQIPIRGAAFYDRKRDDGHGGRRGSLGVAAGGIAVQYVEMPAILFHGDLDKRLQYMTHTPGDVREIPAFLAFDLRKARGRGKVKMTIASVIGCAPFELTGKVSSVDAEGRQTIEVKMVPARRGGTPGSPTARVSGQITIKRRVDLAKGRVAEFESELQVKIDYPEPPPNSGPRPPTPAGGPLKEIGIKESWRFNRFEANRGGNFRTEIAETIKRGGEFLLDQLGHGGGGRQQIRGGTPHHVDEQFGELALVLLTLIKVEVSTKNAKLLAAFDRLRQRDLRDTYSLSLAMMAMEALYAPVAEREHLISGRIKSPLARKLPADDLALMTKWTERLLSHHDHASKPDSVLRFHYNTGSRMYDNSNSQYALLALYSAHLCGVPIRDEVWTASTRHWLADLKPGSKKSIKLSITGHSAYRKIRDRERSARLAAEAANKALDPTRTVSARSDRRTTSGKRTKPSGWPYVAVPKGATGTPNRPVPVETPNTGSMTTAGLTALAICRAVLRSEKKGSPMLGEVSAARSAGLAWMVENFSVRDNRFSHGWYWYYMYGLERAFELNQVALLGHRDWYYEGATLLLAMRSSFGRGRRGGSGGVFHSANIYQTCFAILFLKQAAPPLPVITGGR